MPLQRTRRASRAAWSGRILGARRAAERRRWAASAIRIALMDPTQITREVATWYPLSIIACFCTISAALFWRPLGPLSAPREPRSPWDSAWYLAVYLSAFESVKRLIVILSGSAAGHAGGTYFLRFAGATSLSVLATAFCLCIGSERIASRRGLPARRAGSIPIPLFAALLAVAASWAITFAIFTPGAVS
jgi:hypothetical protein